jgi:hypothetical protein
MTTPPVMLDLTHCLLAYEAAAAEASEPSGSETLRVYEKLRLSLSAFAGVAGFQSLASRALGLAKMEVPSLREARVASDGALEGLGEGLGQSEPQLDSDSEHRIENDKDRAGEYTVGGGGTILIAHLLGLLLIFLGEPLTLSLLRMTWPGATFDDRNSGNGRES